MAKFVKVILFFGLMLILCWVITSISTDQVEQLEHTSESPFTQQDKVRASEIPYLPIAELSGLQTHQMSMTRMQRQLTIEYSSSLKSILLSYASRETSLLLNKRRIFSTLNTYHYLQTNEYYVFALRHIII